MDLEIENGHMITFTTKRVGKKDLVRDGGTHRGRHTVKVTMLVGSDYADIAGRDFFKLYEKEPDDYYEKVKEKSGLECDNLSFRVAWYSRSLYEGLYESSQGKNKKSRHDKAYEPHPSGVRGVLVHKETGDLYIMGVLINEEIIERDPNGDARKVEKKPSTGSQSLIVKAIQKHFRLVSGKWRTYKLPAGTTINGIDTKIEDSEPTTESED